MSAVLKEPPRLEAMRPPDLDEVMAIESAIYSHPWTRGNFADSLRAGYDCRTWRLEGELIGYFVLTAAAGEAHLLNLCVTVVARRAGLGTQLLETVMERARLAGAERMHLEVRPSNDAAIALYIKTGFERIGVRRRYYRASSGSEDAVLLARSLYDRQPGH